MLCLPHPRIKNYKQIIHLTKLHQNYKQIIHLPTLRIICRVAEQNRFNKGYKEEATMRLVGWVEMQSGLTPKPTFGSWTLGRTYCSRVPPWKGKSPSPTRSFPAQRLCDEKKRSHSNWQWKSERTLFAPPSVIYGSWKHRHHLVETAHGFKGWQLGRLKPVKQLYSFVAIAGESGAIVVPVWSLTHNTDGKVPRFQYWALPQRAKSETTLVCWNLCVHTTLVTSWVSTPMHSWCYI